MSKKMVLTPIEFRDSKGNVVRTNAIIDKSLDEIHAIVDEAIEDASNAGETIKLSIEEKGERVIESIPDDYTELSNSVKALGLTVVDGKLCVRYESEE